MIHVLPRPGRLEERPQAEIPREEAGEAGATQRKLRRPPRIPEIYNNVAIVERKDITASNARTYSAITICVKPASRMRKICLGMEKK